ncbi:MAG: GGDEF domain-containing protein [Sphingorhabdus sp.]
MSNLALFFWLLPVTYAVISAMFFVTARLEKRHRTAKIAALGFAVAFVAIVLDTQRALFPWWVFSLAVPLHWMVLVCIADAYLLRHNDRLPRIALVPLIAIGGAINFGCTFIIDSATIRVPNASIAAALIVAIATYKLARYHKGNLDRVVAFVMAANLICYTVRIVMWFYLEQGTGYMRQSAFSDYMTMFYFTSGIAMFATALLLMVTIITDIVARNQIEATMDSLTELLNRRGYDHVITESRATGDGFGAVIAIDLDDFKVINDRYGHAGGDQVLVQVAAILRSHCEYFGPVARMGGEEFLILVKRSHAAGVEILANTLRVAISGLRLTNFPENFRVTASIGIANVMADGSIEDACRKADVALYAAKGSGRNRVVVSAAA